MHQMGFGLSSRTCAEDLRLSNEHAIPLGNLDPFWTSPSFVEQ
jgi:hypothetical protein